MFWDKAVLFIEAPTAWPTAWRSKTSCPY